MTNYKDLTADISKNISKIAELQPDVMKAFNALSASAKKENVLDKKTKEFTALGIAVAARCDGCIGFHTKTLISLGATKEEFSEVLAMAIYMGGGPSLMYAANAMQAWEDFSK
ncbi:MAG: carboxymuconolactone decarboxylase family protein [Alphaproteobacteria bacterium]|jgi:AhpD family alkylhydroperoxidase|nr:carboxymuconolactone decarboxylase family protein [Alphaproteobacteria bacterium]